MAVKGLHCHLCLQLCPRRAENEGETPKPRRLLFFGSPRPGRGRRRGPCRTSFAPPRCSPRRSSRRCRPTSGLPPPLRGFHLVQDGYGGRSGGALNSFLFHQKNLHFRRMSLQSSIPDNLYKSPTGASFKAFPFVAFCFVLFRLFRIVPLTSCFSNRLFKLGNSYPKNLDFQGSLLRRDQSL
jgi:hypothetical protein